MKVYVTYAIGPFAQEIDLIERLCEFEGHTFSMIYPENPEFKKYYKGHRPAIVLPDIMVNDKPVVLYGFWQFAEWQLKNGMLRC